MAGMMPSDDLFLFHCQLLLSLSGQVVDEWHTPTPNAPMQNRKVIINSPVILSPFRRKSGETVDGVHELVPFCFGQGAPFAAGGDVFTWSAMGVAVAVAALLL